MNEKIEAILTLNYAQYKNSLKNAETESKIIGKQIQNNLNIKPSYTAGMTPQEIVKTYNERTGKNVHLIEGTTSELEDVGEEAEVTGNKLSNMFSMAKKKALKFSLALFSIRSIWSLISRAASSYLSTNEELNAKVQTTTQIMGQMLAPIIKRVVDLAQYGVIILAKVIQLFTGYNALANITTKSLNGTAKASKNLNKSLASFDTISNLGDQTSGLSGDIASSVSALDDFQQKVDKINNFFKDNEAIIKAIGSALLVTFGANTISKIAKVLGVAGTGATAAGASGLAGILSVVALLAVARIVIPIAIDGVKQVVKDLKDVDELISTSTSGTDKLKTSQKNLSNQMKKTAEQTGKNSKENEDYNKLLKNQIENSLSLNDSYQKQIDYMMQSGSILTINGGKYVELRKAQKDMMDVVVDSTLKMKEQYDQGKLSSKMVETYRIGLQKSIEYLTTYNSSLSKNSEEYKTNKEKIEELKTQLDKINGYNPEAKVKVKADTSDFNKKMKNILSSTGQALLKSALNVVLPGASAIANWLNSFDVGTNYVPNDQLAMVHKGEMIVPKKYNPATSGIGTGNDETNRLLNRLIVTLENKDMNAYIDPNDIGRASVGYINEQSRKMGRKLI